jgi:hypothetical protein
MSIHSNKRIRRIIGKENQHAHMAALRERNANAPKAPITQREPDDLDRIDGPVLSIQGVARLLFLSVNTVRHIPFAELPYSTGPGRRNLYLIGDIIRYMRSRINEQFHGDKVLSDRKRQIDSLADSVRECSS